MRDIIVGQVLSLRIRFNNTGTISDRRHPYLVIDVNDELDFVEIAQLDTVENKRFKAAMRSNKMILHDNPTEKVIDKDSFAQLDNTLKIEYFDELSQYRRQKDTLSENKLMAVLKAYHQYHERFEIDENKIVYMSKEEIISLNS